MTITPSRPRGFTLIELMIVVAVIGVLLGIALPAYEGQTIAAKRTIGKAELLAVLARQEQYFLSHRRYAASFDALGYRSSPYAIDATGQIVDIDSPTRVYLMTIDQLEPADAPISYVLRAIPQLRQVRDKRCGILEISSAGAQRASTGEGSRCW